MPTFARAVLLAAGLHAASLTAPSLALAQAAQPVPYQTAPVPYGQPTPAPAPPAPALPAPALPPTAPPAQPSTTGTRALSPNSAPSVGADVIYLRNGGILRGTIIDAIPNAQARIQLATGEIATVPWSEIARFDHAGATPPSSLPQRRPNESPEPNRTASSPVPQVLVHIDSPSPVDLQRRVDPDATAVALGTRARAKASWETVCTAPCDRAVPAHGSYRIAGSGARPSREFMLPDAGRPVSLNVSPSSNGWFIGGIVLLSVGSITALVGLCIGLIGSLASTVDSSGTAQDWATGGWTTFAIGGVGAVVGAIALVGNMHSDVSFPTADTAAKGPGSPWAHVASWREPAPVERAVPPALAAPVFKLSF